MHLGIRTDRGAGKGLHSDCEQNTTVEQFSCHGIDGNIFLSKGGDFFLLFSLSASIPGATRIGANLARPVSVLLISLSLVS